MVEFDEFVATRGQALVRLAYLLCADFHLAEDLVQSALAKAYLRWSRLAGMQHPEAYVRKAVVREHLSWHRKASSRELSTADRPDGAVDEVSPDPSIEIAASDWLWQTVKVLPPRQRTVLVLRYFLDLPDEQIAELMRCTTGTVRSHASHALTALRNDPALSVERET